MYIKFFNYHMFIKKSKKLELYNNYNDNNKTITLIIT